MDVFRTPDEAFAALPGHPFAPRYVEQDGLRLHYVDEGLGDPVLLLHGEPTWSYLYRRLVPPLARLARVVAPDYFGFGRSDKPTDVGWYSFDRHYRSIERLAEQLDLRRTTVVVHDWGGPIGLRLAVEHPERVDRLVVMNTGVVAGHAPSDEWLRFRELVRRVGTELRPGQLVRISCVQELPDFVVAAYEAPFPVPEAKAGVLAFPELVPTELSHPSAPAMLAVRDGLRAWEKPTLVLFSDSDPIFSPRDAEQLAALIPGAGPAEVVDGAGHFLQEDAGERIADRIAAFLLSSPAQGGFEPSLENLLVRNGVVSLDQLAAALREQTETGVPFTAVLVRDRLVTADDLARVQRSAQEPPHLPSPLARAEPPAPPEPGPEPPRAGTGYRVVGRLVNGDEIEIASVDDEAHAQRIARDAMRAAANPTGDWPVLNGRYVRPDAIVSVQVVERYA